MEPGGIDKALLEEMEAFSITIARNAGHILLEQFGTSLDISFKGTNNTDPVTSADHQSEEYLRKEITGKFPGHAILSEETGVSGKPDSPFIWVIDPLDGTSNFMNGLPFFAVSIGVLWRGRPVAGSVYVPVSHGAREAVYHARLGNGAFCDNERITVAAGESKRPLVELPVHGYRRFQFSEKIKKQAYDARNLGSIAMELALTAAGIFRFALFGNPKIWDVAAGILLVHEAGGLACTRDKKGKEWLSVEQFRADTDSEEDSAENLKKWSLPLIAGVPETVRQTVDDIKVSRPPLSRLQGVFGSHPGKKKSQVNDDAKAG